MIDPTFLVNGVLNGVLGSRKKKSRKALRFLTAKNRHGAFSNANMLLTAAGVAWGVIETLQAGASGGGAGVAGPGMGAASGTAGTGASNPFGGGAAAPPPIPGSPSAAGIADVPGDAVRLVRLAISAANADGSMTDPERAALLDRFRGTEAEALLEGELAYRRPLAEIVREVPDPAQRATLYVLAYSICRADEQVSGAERIYLAQLAHLLQLDPVTVTRLEADAAARIDAQD